MLESLRKTQSCDRRGSFRFGSGGKVAPWDVNNQAPAHAFLDFDSYDDMVHQLNAAVVNVWLYRTPYSLIADHHVKGLNTARDVAFGNYDPKTWLGDLWLSN